MKITELTLTEAWRRTAARHPLLDTVGLPPVVHSADEVEEWVERAGRAGMEDAGLCLLLDEDGTVHGHHDPSYEAFATRDLDQVLYLIAEDAMRRRGGVPAETADALDRIDPVWGRRFRGGGLDDPGTMEACGRDPLEGLAWMAVPWTGQNPYTTLAFHRAEPGRTVDPARLALLYGADPAQVAAGTRLKDLDAADGGRAHGAWESCCYGQAGEWTFLLYHDTPPGAFTDKEAYADLGIRESVWLAATAAKAIYTFDYVRDGRRVDDDHERGMLELLWYEYGRAPYLRGGELDFLNRAVRRAELDHPELTNTYELYFHALEESLGLRLPRRDFEAGEVRTAYWAGE